MTNQTIRGRRKALFLFQFGTQFCRRIVTGVAVDVISQFVVQFFGGFLFAFFVSCRRHFLVIRLIAVLKMTGAAFADFLS